MVSPNCPGCEQLKEHLTRNGRIGEYRVIDVSTKDGMRIADDLGIMHVPNCIVVEKTEKGLRARACTDNEFTEIIEGKPNE